MAFILTDAYSLPRVKVTFRIDWGTSRECEHHGDSVTVLSPSGCFIRTVKAASNGDTIFLRLWDSPAGAILRCRVAYVLKVGVGPQTVGIGLDFVGLNDRQREHLEHLLEVYREADAADSPPALLNCPGVVQGSRAVAKKQPHRPAPGRHGLSFGGTPIEPPPAR